jgi:tetrahydromethanopterin:alpha-L-glutamate ligase
MQDRLRVAVAGIPGAWSTERLEQALEGAGAVTFAFSLAECTFSITDGAVVLGDQDLGMLDGLVVKKLGRSGEAAAPSRVKLLQQLEFRGVRVFSPADGIREVNDRYQMTQRLAQAGLPLPRTVVTESVEVATEVVEDWGRVVVKPLYTSKGRGMLLLEREEAYRLKLRQWQRHWETPFYLQEYVPRPGRDIGVAVLGGESPGAYYRVARPGSWLTTRSADGHYEPCALTPEMRRLACMAADLFGLDFTIVDLVEARGGYLIYEVSAFGGFAGLWQTHGIDAARLYADHVVRALGAPVR